MNHGYGDRPAVMPEAPSDSHVANAPCSYLTKQQIARLHALTIDAVIGAQLRTWADDMSAVLVDTVQVHPDDNRDYSRHFVIFTDGSFEETT